MRVGIAFDLKPTDPLPVGAPDDLYEEFDSPGTVRAIAEVLTARGDDVIELGNGQQLLRTLLDNPPDFVFNIAEGTGISRNREARVPAVCEMLGIPCTGSDPLTLAASLDKDICRRLVADAEVIVPQAIVLQCPAVAYDGDHVEFPAILAESGLKLPLIAKPVCEGSSKGIRAKCLIESLDRLGPTIAELWRDYGQSVLLEEFIAGDEVTVGIIGNDSPQIYGMMRVVPKTVTDRFVYGLEVKRNWEALVEYESPPKLPFATLNALEEAALTAYMALECRDVARIDFRVRDGIPYFLEANPLPGLNPESSDLVFIGKLQGRPYAELIDAIMDAALERSGLPKKG